MWACGRDMARGVATYIPSSSKEAMEYSGLASSPCISASLTSTSCSGTSGRRSFSGSLSSVTDAGAVVGGVSPVGVATSSAQSIFFGSKSSFSVVLAGAWEAGFPSARERRDSKEPAAPDSFEGVESDMATFDVRSKDKAVSGWRV